ncbi:MAG: hypothetical protein KF684_11675 [Phycisphaeraceae bacterium]|nr:hypothetical protein [Phycisphaeraceae bacterium]
MFLLAAVVVLPAVARSYSCSVILTESGHERDRIEAIAASFQRFHDESGRFPENEAEWRGATPEHATLLDAGPFSVEPKYRVRWDNFGDKDRIVTMSPDRDFRRASVLMLPGDKRGAERYSNRTGHNRWMILGDGSVVHARLWGVGEGLWEARKDFADWAGWEFNEERPRER